mmetsp:Transcript_53171/g.164793  ORF Transcript_53171/g.164793 Transcript_53171/m.164793 type:complete len:312 (-) Transcript_53171:1468-2403(-)
MHLHVLRRGRHVRVQHALVVAVEPDLEVLEAVRAQRHGVAKHSVALRLHRLRLRPLGGRPRPSDVVLAPRLGAVRQLAPAGGPEGDRVPVPPLPGPDLVVVHLTPGDDVGHRARDALGADVAEGARALEGDALRVEVEGLPLPGIYVRVQLEQVVRGHLHVVLGGEDGLVELHHADRFVHVAVVGLDRTDAQHSGLGLAAGTEGIRNGPDAHGVREDSGLRPALTHLDVQVGERRLPHALVDELGLPRSVGRGQAGRVADVVREDGGEVPVPRAALVLHRHAVDHLGEGSDRASGATLPAHVAGRGDVEGR